MLGHALADSGELLQLIRVFRQLLNRLMHSGNQFGGFFITAIAADNCTVNLEELRRVAKDAGDRLVVHALIIMREGASRERDDSIPSRTHVQPNTKRKTGKVGTLCRRIQISFYKLTAGFLHIGSLRTLRSLHNLELDRVSFLQSAITFSDDGRIMNEYIRAVIASDKAVPLRVIEPFHGATQAWASLNKCFSFRLRPSTRGADLDQKLRGV